MSDAGGPSTRGLAHALWSMARPWTFQARAPSHVGLRYDERDRSGVQPLCDVYLPDTDGPHPSVLVIHGGGFLIGHRRMRAVQVLATKLCAAGFAVCSVDYRLLLRGGGLEVQLADVELAASFWQRQCSRYGCDPVRISGLGLSAGAALLLLHSGATELAYERLVFFYPVTDFGRLRRRRAELVMTGLLGSRDRAVWRERSPLRAATHPAPALFLHGTDDHLVDAGHSRDAHRARLASGLPSELDLYFGMPHAWLNDPALPETDRALSRVISFLSRS